MCRRRRRRIAPCRNTGAVERALANSAEAGKGTGVVHMTVTGADGRQMGYWMRIKPRRKDEGEKDGAGARRGGKGLKPHQRFIGFAMDHKPEKPRQYKKRWGIETRSKMVSDRRNKTSNALPSAHLHCFGYSLLASNAWAVINSVFWRRPPECVPRILPAAVLFMSVRMLEVREPKPPP